MHAGGGRGALLINSHQGGCLRVLASAEVSTTTVRGGRGRGRRGAAAAGDGSTGGGEGGDGISDGRQERGRETTPPSTRDVNLSSSPLLTKATTPSHRPRRCASTLSLLLMSLLLFIRLICLPNKLYLSLQNNVLFCIQLTQVQFL